MWTLYNDCKCSATHVKFYMNFPAALKSMCINTGKYFILSSIKANFQIRLLWYSVLFTADNEKPTGKWLTRNWGTNPAQERDRNPVEERVLCQSLQLRCSLHAVYGLPFHCRFSFVAPCTLVNERNRTGQHSLGLRLLSWGRRNPVSFKRKSH